MAVEAGRVSGVRLASGEQISARKVVSNSASARYTEPRPVNVMPIVIRFASGSIIPSISSGVLKLNSAGRANS